MRPAIAVTIVDFRSVQRESEKSHQQICLSRTRNKNLEYPDEELQLFFVELPKFKKDLAELSSLSDKWIYFLKDAPSLEIIPENLGEVEEIKMALTIANQASMTEDELEIADRRSIALQDEKGRIDYAREQGEREGREQGKEEGRFQGSIALVMRQIKKRFGEVPADAIATLESLLLSDLESLTEDIFDFNSLEDLSAWLQERKRSSS